MEAFDSGSSSLLNYDIPIRFSPLYCNRTLIQKGGALRTSFDTNSSYLRTDKKGI